VARPESINAIGAVLYVYLLASRKHGTLYVGVTNNLIRRVYQRFLTSLLDMLFKDWFGLKLMMIP
jgi:hypothetical protein